MERPASAGQTLLNSSSLKHRARYLGFDLCGVAPAEKHPKLARLAQWIADGRAGEMAYLAESLEERLDPLEVLPTAKSIISVACVYNTDVPYSAAITEEGRVSIARYAWGDDYHDVMRARLRALLQWMSETHGPGLEAFSCVDNGPLQERVYAERAGLGWIGKNTCVINPTLGSWLVLGEIITNAAITPDQPATDQCGTCTRCLDACPTGAITQPYEIDATQCLSYLTIEKRGSIDEALRPAIGRQVLGCDICQDVCPWNRRASTSADAAWQPREGLAHPRLLDLCRLSDEAWWALLRGSAMRRAGLPRIRRSLAYAAARLGPDAAAALDALAAHPSAQRPEVAEAIEWAKRSAEGAAGFSRP